MAERDCWILARKCFEELAAVTKDALKVYGDLKVLKAFVRKAAAERNAAGGLKRLEIAIRWGILVILPVMTATAPLKKCSENFGSLVSFYIQRQVALENQQNGVCLQSIPCFNLNVQVRYYCPRQSLDAIPCPPLRPEVPNVERPSSRCEYDKPVSGKR
jgi:hypothetical protein